MVSLLTVAAVFAAKPTCSHTHVYNTDNIEYGNTNPYKRLCSLHGWWDIRFSFGCPGCRAPKFGLWFMDLTRCTSLLIWRRNGDLSNQRRSYRKKGIRMNKIRSLNIACGKQKLKNCIQSSKCLRIGLCFFVMIAVTMNVQAVICSTCSGRRVLACVSCNGNGGTIVPGPFGPIARHCHACVQLGRPSIVTCYRCGGSGQIYIPSFGNLRIWDMILHNIHQ